MNNKSLEITEFYLSFSIRIIGFILVLKSIIRFYYHILPLILHGFFDPDISNLLTLSCFLFVGLLLIFKPHTVSRLFSIQKNKESYTVGLRAVEISIVIICLYFFFVHITVFFDILRYLIGETDKSYKFRLMDKYMVDYIIVIQSIILLIKSKDFAKMIYPMKNT